MSPLARCVAALVLMVLLIAIGQSAPSARRLEPLASHSATTQARGVVTSDGQPIAGATVRLQGRRESAVTDAHGRFTLANREPSIAARLIASSPGMIIAGRPWSKDEPELHFDLRPHTTDDHGGYEWVAPQADAARQQQCGNCHQQMVDEWSASAHAQSANNRRFLDQYEGTDWHGQQNRGKNLLAERPEAAGVCYSCHYPSAEPDVALLSDLRQVQGVARQGVHCDFCHKIAEVDVTRVGLNHGRFAMRLARPAEGQLFFGPLNDVDRGEDVYSPLYSQSQYCASCHEGTLLGTHAYSTYSEWQKSSAARRGVQCQNCHMAPSGTMTNIAPGRGGIERDPATLAAHRFPGFDTQFLHGHLQLSLTAKRGASGIEVAAEVRPRDIGHAVPTGHPSRNMILWLEARTAEGGTLEQTSGSKLPALAGVGPRDAGALAGRPGKLYAKVLEGPRGEQPIAYWQDNRLAYDSRIAPDTVDRQDFVFAASASKVVITARLLFRRFYWAEAAEKSWPDNELLVAEMTVTVE
ncbi:MAG: carboxypeptidase regulatory-like domain-containing protein [Planctomycetes bacterium]|nr:carboxypeptidase regulatory-like domain-containing protein [Planctomycetota bacterium]